MDDLNPLQADLYRQARRAAERKIGFLIHLFVYLCVNSMLFVINEQAGGPPWHFGPLFGWGIGLLFHGLSVWLRSDSSEWKRRMIESELKKLSMPPRP